MSRRKVLTRGSITFTANLCPQDQKVLEELARRMRKSRSAAFRTAIHMALHIVRETEDRNKEILTADPDGANPVVLHFVM